MHHAILLEWQLLRRDRAIQLALALLAALLIVAVIVGRDAQQAEIAALDEAAERVQSEWETQPPKNPHEAAHYGLLVYRPAAPLQAIEPGVLPYQGAAIFLEAHQRNAPFLSPASVRAADSRFGGTRVSPLLNLAGAFLALIIGYLIGAREARRGVSPLLAGAGAKPAALVAAKALTTFGLVTLAASPALLLGAMGLSGADALGRFAVFALGSLAHLGTLAAFGVAAGYLIGASPGGLAALTMVWALGALIAPRVADIAAEQILPSTQTALAATIAADFALGPDGHAEGPSAANEKFKRDTLAKYGVERVQDLPVNFDALLMQADEEYRSGVYDRRLAEADRRRQAQDAVRAIAWALSPTPAALDLSARMAGSHADYQRRFDQAAEAFRRDFVERLNLHMAENSRSGDWSWTPEDGYYASFAAFDPPRPSFAEDLRGAVPAMTALMLWSAAALLALMLAGRRQPLGNTS